MHLILTHSQIIKAIHCLQIRMKQTIINKNGQNRVIVTTKQAIKKLTIQHLGSQLAHKAQEQTQ